METWTVYLASLLLLGLVYIFILLFLRDSAAFPDDIPISGLRNEVFRVVRASLRQLTDGMSTLMEGYRKVRELYMWLNKELIRLGIVLGQRKIVHIV